MSRLLYQTTHCTTPDPYGINVLIFNRFVKGWTYPDPCHSFCNAILDALPEDKALETKAACLVAASWLSHCLTAALMAHNAGLPVETIRFLAVLHLGGIANE
jgi:hypothetical protein